MSKTPIINLATTTPSNIATSSTDNQNGLTITQLPNEILRLIYERLPDKQSKFAFKGVCRKFREIPNNPFKSFNGYIRSFAQFLKANYLSLFDKNTQILVEKFADFGICDLEKLVEIGLETFEYELLNQNNTTFKIKKFIVSSGLAIGSIFSHKINILSLDKINNFQKEILTKFLALLSQFDNDTIIKMLEQKEKGKFNFGFLDEVFIYAIMFNEIRTPYEDEDISSKIVQYKFLYDEKYRNHYWNRELSWKKDQIILCNISSRERYEGAQFFIQKSYEKRSNLHNSHVINKTILKLLHLSFVSHSISTALKFKDFLYMHTIVEIIKNVKTLEQVEMIAPLYEQLILLIRERDKSLFTNAYYYYGNKLLLFKKYKEVVELALISHKDSAYQCFNPKRNDIINFKKQVIDSLCRNADFRAQALKLINNLHVGKSSDLYMDKENFMKKIISCQIENNEEITSIIKTIVSMDTISKEDIKNVLNIIFFTIKELKKINRENDVIKLLSSFKKYSTFIESIHYHIIHEKEEYTDKEIALCKRIEALK